MNSNQVPSMTSLPECDQPPSWVPHPQDWVPGVGNSPQMSLHQAGAGRNQASLASHPPSSLPMDVMGSIEIMTTAKPRTLLECTVCNSLWWDIQTLVDHMQTQHGCHFACLSCVGRTFDRKLRIDTSTNLFAHFRRCHQSVPESRMMDYVDIRTGNHRVGCKCGQCELETIQEQLIELGVGRKSPPFGGSPISWSPTGPVLPLIAPPSPLTPEGLPLIQTVVQNTNPVRDNPVCSNSQPSQLQWQGGLVATSPTWEFGPMGPAASEVKEFFNPPDGKDATYQELHNLNAGPGQRENLSHESCTEKIRFLQMKLAQKDQELKWKVADFHSALECSKAAVATFHKDKVVQKHSRNVEGLLDQQVKRLLRKRQGSGASAEQQTELDQTRAELKKARLEKRVERSNFRRLLNNLFETATEHQDETNAEEGSGDVQ